MEQEIVIYLFRQHQHLIIPYINIILAIFTL